MNAGRIPKSALERIAAQPAARQLGPIHTWNEESLYTVLSHAYQLPFREILFSDVDAALFHRFQSFFIKNGQMPLKLLPGAMVVTECEPWDERKIQEILQEFEVGVKRILITQRNYDTLLGSLSRHVPPPAPKPKAEVRYEFLPNQSWDGLETSEIFREIVRRADLMKASDIHLEPAEGEMRVRYRVHGNLLVQRKLGTREGEEVLKALKLEAHLLNRSSDSFQSSRIRTVLPHSKTLDLRIEISPTVEGESVVIRLLDFGNIQRSVSELNFPRDYQKRVLESISKTSGLIIVTGPTGSGKTTTLYTLLQHLDSKSMKVITVEDPVEYRIRNFTQIQIDPDKGVTFPTSVRSCLRQDPDVLLIGEIRDHETAAQCVSAAETGHLVFSTLHTTNAIETLNRLAELKVDRYQLQTLIRVVLAQRLVSVLCPDCKTGREIRPYERELLEKLHIPFDPNQLVYEKRGCSQCKGVGTIGRVAAYSLFHPSPVIREMMGTNCPIMNIINQARSEGFRTVMEHALESWLRGDASFSEVHSLEDAPI